jgi:hypothetical protein
VTVRYDGTNWQMGAGGSSIYFGQGDAAAAAGNNAVTLGSTPLSGSLSIFVGGQILRPSTAYTLSGTAASLTSSLTSGQVVVANWATSNATPGGITLSTAGGITGIAGWRMNEGSGLTLNDIGGSSDNATISASGAVTWQSNAGFAGTTPLWNGSGNAVASSTTLTNFDGTTAFSVAAWIKTSSTSEEAFMGTLNASAGNYQGWEIQKRSSGGQLLFFLINNYPTNYVSVYGSTVIDNGSLHYVVATYDGSRTAAGVKLYVDGSLETMTVVSNNLSATSANSLPARFGARNNASDEYTGVLAFTEIWNSVLTSTQVSTFYAAGPQLN